MTEREKNIHLLVVQQEKEKDSDVHIYSPSHFLILPPIVNLFIYSYLHLNKLLVYVYVGMGGRTIERLSSRFALTGYTHREIVDMYKNDTLSVIIIMVRE